MESESNMKTDKKNHRAVSVSSHPQKEGEKSGFLRRFLDWLAEGAKKSSAGGTSCPT